MTSAGKCGNYKTLDSWKQQEQTNSLQQSVPYNVCHVNERSEHPILIPTPPSPITITSACYQCLTFLVSALWKSILTVG